ESHWRGSVNADCASAGRREHAAARSARTGAHAALPFVVAVGHHAFHALDAAIQSRQLLVQGNQIRAGKRRGEIGFFRRLAASANWRAERAGRRALQILEEKGAARLRGLAAFGRYDDGKEDVEKRGAKDGGRVAPAKRARKGEEQERPEEARGVYMPTAALGNALEDAETDAVTRAADIRTAF